MPTQQVYRYHLKKKKKKLELSDFDGDFVRELKYFWTEMPQYIIIWGLHLQSLWFV